MDRALAEKTAADSNGSFSTAGASVSGGGYAAHGALRPALTGIQSRCDAQVRLLIDAGRSRAVARHQCLPGPLCAPTLNVTVRTSSRRVQKHMSAVVSEFAIDQPNHTISAERRVMIS